MAAEDVCETVLEPTLLKYNEAAEYLNVSSSTLYAMVSNGRVPVVRMGSGPKGQGDHAISPRGSGGFRGSERVVTQS